MSLKESSPIMVELSKHVTYVQFGERVIGIGAIMMDYFVLVLAFIKYVQLFIHPLSELLFITQRMCFSTAEVEVGFMWQWTAEVSTTSNHPLIFKDRMACRHVVSS
jgi:hypothetical protein